MDGSEIGQNPPVPSPRRNRVDPWGDLQAVAARGLFTGNRGCVVDDQQQVVRHHAGSLWITCVTRFRDWRWPLARAGRWTPLFFLDEAVALAAGHRPCGLCRRDAYRAYREAVSAAAGASRLLRANELNARLARERLRRGRGLMRAKDRIRWQARCGDLPDGTVIEDDRGEARLIIGNRLMRFDFSGWCAPEALDTGARVAVLTPPSSVAAMRLGYRPVLHPSALD